MPYPHHPQHQHHQKNNSPSQLRRVTMTSHSCEAETKPVGDVIVTNSAGQHSEVDLGNGHDGATGPPLPSQTVSPSTSASLPPTSVMPSVELSPTPTVMTSLPQPHDLPPHSLAMSVAETHEAQDESEFLTGCQLEDVTMMPLDLSFRSRRPGTHPRQTQTPDLLSGSSSSKSCISSHGHSRPYRLSPYPLFNLGLARSPGATGLPPSRSPQSRSDSPFFSLNRQTPSPFYSSLSQHGSSYFNLAENSSFQVLSATNRVLNGLSSSSSVFRPYEDQMPSDATPTPPPATPGHLPAEEVQDPAENEEPTYFDLDAVVEPKPAAQPSGRSSVNSPSNSSSLLCDHQFQVVTPLTPDYHGNNASPYITPVSVHDGTISRMVPFSKSSSSVSPSSPCSSSPPALLPSFIPQDVSEQARCDLARQPVTINGYSYPSYSNCNKATPQKSILQSFMSHKSVVSQGKQEEYSHQQQDPDSSSGVSTLESSPGSSQSSQDPSCGMSVSPTLSQRHHQPYESSSSKQYPECDGSVTSTGTIISNKENFRDAHFRPHSFFRAPDKDFVEQTCRILAEKHRNEGAHRMSLLDFWISKIRIAASQSQKSDICRSQENRSKIKIRMVELMELQVEQSLRCDWR